MAKLMRITTEDPNGRFDVNLNEGFYLPPNSTIALQSANFTRETPSFEIGPSNDTFTFQTNTGNNREIRIRDLTDSTIRRYDRSSFTDLLMNMTASINAGLNTLTGPDLGVQALVTTDDTQHVTIEFRRQGYLIWTGNPAPAIGHQIIQHNITRDNNSQMFKTASTGVLPNGTISTSLCADKLDICIGAGVITARVLKYEEADQTGNASDGSGFFMGVMEDSVFQQLEHQGGVGLDESDFVTAIYMKDDNVSRAANPTTACIAPGATAGNPQTSAVCVVASDSEGNTIYNGRNAARVRPHCVNAACETRLGGGTRRDVYQIEVRNGIFTCVQYREGGGALLDPELTDAVRATASKPINKCDPNKIYHAFIGLYGTQDTTILENVGVINNPYTKQPAETNNQIVFDNGNTLGTPNVSVAESIYDFKFLRLDAAGNEVPNPDLANFLGYNNLIQLNTSQTPGSRITFRAPFTTRAALRAETYLIQLISRSVESYDSLSGGKENTIYTIVKDVVETGVEEEINFNSNYPIYIQLKNKNEVLLRDLKARIVDSDIKELTLMGRSQLSLLFGTE